MNHINQGPVLSGKVKNEYIIKDENVIEDIGVHQNNHAEERKMFIEFDQE